MPIEYVRPWGGSWGTAAWRGWGREGAWTAAARVWRDGVGQRGDGGGRPAHIQCMLWGSGRGALRCGVDCNEFILLAQSPGA